MCGIAGAISLDGTSIGLELTEALVSRLVHRGPDAATGWTDGRVALGHTRLAVIDLETGDQPIENEDGSVVVAFNGEIFNHRELQTDLERAHTFRTRSDTEVLVHLYEERGIDLVHALRGFFAFSLWDATRGRLVLARDRLGQKPLYFAHDSRRLAWASEPAALVAAGAVEPAADRGALEDALHLRYVRGTRSGFAGVERLAPGELLVVEDGRARRESYWTPPRHAPSDASYEESVVEFRRRFDSAVAARLEADVPLGLLLSGGIDSTAVLEAAARASVRPVRTFSVSFAREKESEASYAALAARHLGAEHTEIPLSEEDLVVRAKRVLMEIGEPFADPSLLPTRLVCEAARREVTVALTGDGGDEAFAGYSRYLRVLEHARGTGAGREPSALKKLSRRMRRIGSSLPDLDPPPPSTPYEAWGRACVRIPSALVAFVAGPSLQGLEPGAYEARLARELEDEVRGGAGLLEAMQRHDQLHDLPAEMLVKVDRASMATALEVRSPFLDHELVEWAATLPVAHRATETRGKVVVRGALEGRVPRELLERSKKGFGTPLGRWFRGPLAPLARELFEESALARDGWLDARALHAVLSAHRERRRNLGEPLWTLCALESWYRSSVRGHASSESRNVEIRWARRGQS